MVDNFCEPFMEKFTDGSFMNVLFDYRCKVAELQLFGLE